MQLAGVKTTQNNRAFAELHEPETESAKFVQKLINLGAVVVSKTQLSAFASAQEPTDHCIDYHAPWNPRGDGYQTPAGSSHGAGAALSGYEWLDYSFGTDSKDCRGTYWMIKLLIFSSHWKHSISCCHYWCLRNASHHRHPINGRYLSPLSVSRSVLSLFPRLNMSSEFDTVGSLARSLGSHYEITRLILGDGVTDFKKVLQQIECSISLALTNFSSQNQCSIPQTSYPMKKLLCKMCWKRSSLL